MDFVLAMVWPLNVETTSKNSLKTGYEKEGKGIENFFSNSYMKCHLPPLGLVSKLGMHTCERHNEEMINRRAVRL